MNELSSGLYFAPTGIAHLTHTNTDLVRAAAHGRTQLRVTTAAQLNGHPHLGTVTTILAVFALTARMADDLNMPATIIFDSLENAPAEHLTIHGRHYTRTVQDLIDHGHLDAHERTSGFRRLLTWASARSTIAWQERPYAVYQELLPVRTCLHAIAQRQDEFAPLLAPADGRIRVRPRCPRCHLVDKDAHDLTMSAGDREVLLDSVCPHHGPYRETIPIHGTSGWYDANTPVRSVQKVALLAAERDHYDACSISMDGPDWGGAWFSHVIAPALALLDIPAHDWPISLFTPMVLDRTGGKLSKSLYVKYGREYADLPPAFLDLDLLLDAYGEEALEALWQETTRWAAEPRRLHRCYTVDHLTTLLRPSHLGVPA
ncbi:hypothetical protein F4561_005738 [Lipingzhangella halophila]|uniref:Uncharacterized protein n=1 Tax=Lipingzhangella halophila TaxID=1783352 RepID=A0A7W7W6F2_9ACTN|nr:hypothetical protein [Lipingzhangella halophila]MBB4934428.1 hypothetical protein [Lipingzhangella halophila]MBB4934844.1 hypothetical protein [Lipingzhangella halophila]